MHTYLNIDVHLYECLLCPTKKTPCWETSGTLTYIYVCMYVSMCTCIRVI